MSILGALGRAGRKAAGAADDMPKRGRMRDTPERAETERKAAVERERIRKNKTDAMTTQRRGSIATRMPVSGEDIRQAKTAAQLDAMQRRIDDMPDGNRKQMMQNLLDRQRAGFEGMQSAEMDRASMRSAIAASNRREFKGTKPSTDLEEIAAMRRRIMERAGEGKAKGGMMTKKYAKGGMANCGASMPATQASTKKMK